MSSDLTFFKKTWEIVFPTRLPPEQSRVRNVGDAVEVESNLGNVKETSLKNNTKV